ncbi:LysM peptidoglycan-binding domain-containing protein [Trueperella bernardiae]|uniref:lytic transglycosylase domain-containing protein n=1 Tax=Trueperella bernardiae TaxID=59561 RepID=UPI002556338B|nr:lytic transglycosylase domain-containing protein [Trueperella bernardiae]WIM08681.1 LysM peptidoglycan-binding domain-containing protein [Trueperella bernardiae]
MSSWLRRSGAALVATTAATFITPVAQAATAPAPQAPVFKTPVFKDPEMTYQVKPGDTLSTIAKRAGTTITAIARANSLNSVNLIFPGQQLKIPSAAQAAAPAAPAAPVQSAPATTAYVVKAGDTLGRIASAHGTTVAKLAADNGIANPNLIHVGQRLTIAPATTPATTAPAAKPATPAAPATKPVAPAATTYVVRAGDTLSGIAAKHGTTVAALVAANGISNPNRIGVGQTLVISGAAQSAPQANAGQSSSGTQTSRPQLVQNNFPGYTYADSTVEAANDNKYALISKAQPSRAEVQSMIVSVARDMGVDPRLALAHAFVESGFDATAVSPANAIGVMQVIPSSGQWASQMVGRNLDLLNPYDNVVAGVSIIRYLQNNASSFDEGIAGYYQGLGGVKKYGMRSDTVAYVAKVKAAMARF